MSDATVQQREIFISWGTVADWNESGCYYTNHVSYVQNQLQQFINLYDKGLVFRGFKPVYWSPSSRYFIDYQNIHRSILKKLL